MPRMIVTVRSWDVAFVIVEENDVRVVTQNPPDALRQLLDERESSYGATQT